MTVEELTFVLERLAEAGCTTEQLLTAARAARDFRTERKLFLAVKRGLAAADAVGLGQSSAGSAPESDFEQPINTDSPDSESYFSLRSSAPAVPEPDRSGSAFPPEPHPDSRKATARKGLLTTRRLRPCARRIGAALVERYNLRTGRCDASVQTLADDAGYDIRSARRAIGQLEGAGLFARALQVGRGNANSYVPQWEALAALAVNADSENRTLGPKPDGRVRQNHKSLSPQDSGDSGQLSLRVFSPIAGGRASPSKHKALVGAEMALRGKYRDDGRLSVFLTAFHALEALDLDLIAEAEIAQRGDGLRTFERMLRERGPPKRLDAGTEGDGGQSAGQATGPPRAASGN